MNICLICFEKNVTKLRYLQCCESPICLECYKLIPDLDDIRNQELLGMDYSIGNFKFKRRCPNRCCNHCAITDNA